MGSFLRQQEKSLYRYSIKKEELQILKLLFKKGFQDCNMYRSIGDIKYMSNSGNNNSNKNNDNKNSSNKGDNNRNSENKNSSNKSSENKNSGNKSSENKNSSNKRSDNKNNGNNNKNTNIEVFEQMPVAKAVRTMAIPTIAGQLIILGYNLADTYFLGRVNRPELIAAASLILPVYNISISLAGLAGAGGGALIARLLGKKQTEEAGKVCSFSFYLGLALAILFAGITYLFLDPILQFLGAGPDTFNYARDYTMCVIVIGAVPTILSNILAMLVRNAGNSKKAGFGIALGGIINIILDPIYMFLIFPEGKEIIGAGAATITANVITFIYFFIVLRKLGKDSSIKLLSPFQLPSKESVKNLFSVGIPYSLATLLFDLNYVILDRLMSGYGDIALASLGIVLKIERFPLNVGTGICQGMMPIVAYNYSSKNLKRMAEVKNYARKVGIIFTLATIVLFELFAGPVVRFFIEESDTMALGMNFLRIRCLATPLMFLSFFHIYLFNGFGKGKQSLFLGTMRWLIFNMPLLYVMNFIFGMYGLVWSQAVGDILTVILSIVVYRKFEASLEQSGSTNKVKA